MFKEDYEEENDICEESPLHHVESFSLSDLVTEVVHESYRTEESAPESCRKQDEQVEEWPPERPDKEEDGLVRDGDPKYLK